MYQTIETEMVARSCARAAEFLLLPPHARHPPMADHPKIELMFDRHPALRSIRAVSLSALRA